MKGIYIYYNEIDEKRISGIDKKVLSQIRLFENNGLDCELVVFPYIHTVKNKILDRIPFTNVAPRWIFDDRFKKIDYIYFRRPFYMGYGFRNFLRKVKKENPTIKIIMEIPTYPYDHEIMAGILNYPLHVKDVYNRERLKGLVDRVPIIGETDNLPALWGIKTIPFVNGIEIKTIQPKKDAHIENEIHLLSVSTIEFWHGYDRMIKGLEKYYKKNVAHRKIIFHIVGTGNDEEQYRQIVKESNLEKCVIFEGELHGDKLDIIYDQSDIAIECLGMYRKNMSISSSLKSREYLAKGLPIVAGCKNDIINEKNPFKYYLEVPNNDSEIDIEKIIEFYDQIYSRRSREQVISEIREFAENNIDLKVTMKKIINYIKE